MANTLRELTDGYVLNQLKLITNQFSDIGKLNNQFNNNFILPNELFAANKAAIQLKNSLANAYNTSTGNINLTEFSKQLKLTGQTLPGLAKDLGMVGAQGTKAFTDLARTIALAEKPLLGTNKIASELWGTLGNTVKWQASSAFIQGILKEVTSATSYVKSLDSSLNSIQIVTNHGAEYMANFAKSANEAAKSLHTTTNEYAKAALIYYQQGLSDKAVQDRVATTIKLANVSGQSAKVVSDQLTAVWNNFYNGSKNLEFYADAMAALGATTASSSSEIAKGLEKFAAIADSTGLSFEYASSALATVVANTRQSADSVGTSFRTLFSRLQGLSLGETLEDGTTLNKYSKALLSVGVNIKQANGDLKNMDTILTELGVKWQALAQDEKVALAQTIGGARNYTGLMSLMDNWDDFTKNLKTAQTAQGTLQTQAEIYAESWEAATARVRAATETLYANLLDDKTIKGIANTWADALNIIGGVTNNLGGFNGTSALLLNIGTRLFQNQLTKGANDLGLTLSSITTSGRDEINELQKKAFMTLTKNVTISSDNEINNMYKNQMKDLQVAQYATDRAIAAGRIAKYEQPIYQQLLNNVANLQSDALQKTIASADIRSNQKNDDILFLRTARRNIVEQGRFWEESGENAKALQKFNQDKTNTQNAIQTARQTRDNTSQTIGRLLTERESLRNTYPQDQAQRDAITQRIAAINNTLHGTVQADGTRSGGLLAVSRSQNQQVLIEQSKLDNIIQQEARLRETIAARDPNGEILRKGGLLDTRFTTARTEASNLANMRSLLKNFGSDLTSNSGMRTAYQTIRQMSADKTNSQYFLNLLGGPDSDLGKQFTELSKQVAQVNLKGNIDKQLENIFSGKNGAVGLGTFVENMRDREANAAYEATKALQDVDRYLKLGDKQDPAIMGLRNQIKEALKNGPESLVQYGEDGRAAAQLLYGAGKINQKEYLKLARASMRHVTGGEGIVSGAQIMSSIGMTVNAMSNAFATLKNDSATTAQKIGALGIAAGTVGNSVVVLGQNMSTFWDKQAKAFTNVGKNTLFTMGAAALIYGAVKGYQTYQNNYGSEGKVKTLNANLALQQQSTTESRENFEQFDTIIKTYNQSLETIKSTIAGTSDYFVAQANANEIANNLIQKYGLVYGQDYSIDDGTLTINQLQQNAIQKRAEDAYINDVAIESVLTQLKNYEEASRIIELREQTLLKEHVDNKVNAAGEINGERGIFNTVKALWAQGEVLTDDYLGIRLHNEDIIARNKAEIQNQLDTDSKIVKAQGQQQLALSALAETILDTQLSKQGISVNDFIKTGFLSDPQLQATLKEIIEEVEQATIDDQGFIPWNDIVSKISGKGITGITLPDNTEITKNEDLWTLLKQEGYVIGEMPETASALESKVKGALPAYLLKDYINNFIQDYSDISNQFENFKSLTSNNFFELINSELQGQEHEAIRASLITSVSNIQSDLLAALSNNINKDWLVSNNLLDSNEFKNLIQNYSLNQLQDISDYIIASGTVFGNKTAQIIFEQLSSNKNTKILQQLSKINWDNTFSALSDINKLAYNLGGSENIYSDVLESAIDAMGGENGLFQKLYSSSGFQDVLSKLTDQFDTMGSITTDYVVKLASKNEELSSLLDLGRSGYSGLNFNVGGLTRTLNLIQSGTLRPGQVTSNLLSALSEGEYSEAVKQNGFAAVDNQNLGRSGTDLLDYFTNAQKAYLNAKSQDLIFDTPLRNVFDTMMPESVRNAYYEANAAAGGGESFQQVMNRADLPQEVKDFLNSTNKKGTKPVTTWAQVNNMYGALIKGAGAVKNTGLDIDTTKNSIGGLNLDDLPEEQKKLLSQENLSLADFMKYGYGLSFSKGNLNLHDTTGNNQYHYTTRETEEHLRKIFEAMGIRNASQLASIHTAQLAESSGGAILRKNDAKAAVDEIISNREPVIPDGKKVYTEAELNAVWESYGTDTGFKTKKDMIDHIIGENAILAPELDTDFWKNNGSDIAGIANKFATANEDYNNGITGGVDGFLSLMEQVGAMKDETLDYDKFKEFMLSTGATETDFDNLFTEDNWNNILGDILSKTIIDKFGNPITVRRTNNENYKDYQKRIEKAQRQAQSDKFSYIGADDKTYTIDDPLGVIREHYHPGENGKPGTWDKDWDPSENAIPMSGFMNDGLMMGINPVTGEMMVYDEKNGSWMSKKKYDDQKIERQQQRWNDASKAAMDREDAAAKEQVLDERNIATANMTDEQKKDYYYNLIEREKEGKGETGPKVASTEEGLYYQQQYDFEHMSEADKNDYYQNLLHDSENQIPLSTFEQEVLDTYQPKLGGAKKEEFRAWSGLTEDEKINLVGALTQDNIRNVWDTASDDMKNDLWNLMSQEQRDLLQYSWDKEKYEAKSDDEKKVTQNGIIRAALDPDHYGPQSLFAQEWLQTEEGQKALLEAQQQQLEEQQAAEEQAMLAEQYEKEKAAYEAMSPEGQAYARQMILEQGFDPILGTSLSSFAQELYDQMTSAVDNMPEQTAENEDALDKWALNALDELGLTEDFFNSNPTGNNALPSAYQYLQNYLQSQDSETAAQLAEQLKIQKLIADNTQLTAESTTEQLDYLGEEAESEFQAQTTGQAAEEQAVDENGNPIFGDQGGTTIINNGSRTDNNGTPGGRSRLGANGANGWFPNDVLGMSNMIGDGRYRISDFGKMGYDLSTLTGSQLQVVAQAQADYDKEHMDTATYNREYLFASGQNNARLLSYASGKEGHIAITGELGPELRVKEDGTMDILGKKGREYAWVDPGDRIYTAQQSAGILKSNKIPGLEGLAKGINNFIPGYAFGDIVGGTNHTSSSGGGGGGGGGGEKSRGGGGGAAAEKDPRYDPQTLKIRDVLERYYTILQQIDNITKAVERFSKVADRAWGRERIRAIEQQNEMQQKQYEAQKKYIAEIEEYLDTDQSALTTMIQEFVTGYNEGKEAADQISWAGAEFDENGVLTNYRDFVEKLVEQYNANAAANAQSKEAQYKFQEQLKDIQMYTDTLNLYEEQKDALEDIKNAILDTAVKAISYEVEYKLELSGDADRILNFQADKYKDDVYQAAKYLELLDKRADETRKNLVSVQDGIFKTLGTYAGEAMRTGAMHNLEELGIYGTEQFKLDEELTDADEEETEEARLDRLRKVSTKVNEWLEQLREKNADAAAEIDKMITHSEEEGQEDIITNYEEVIRRLNAQVDYTAARAKVDEWLEELRGKNAEAAAEIDKIVQRNEAGEIINYRDVIERLNEENVRLSDEAIAVLMEDQDKFFEWMSDFRSNPGWVDFTTEHKDLLTNYMDQIYQYLQSLQETYEQTIEQLGDSIKATAKQMDAAIDEFNYYGDVYKTFGNIVDLTNRHMTDVSQEFFDTLNNKSMDNAINKIKGTVTNYHLLQNELAEVTKQYNEMQARANAATGEEQIYLQQSADKLKEQLDIANSQYEDAHKAFLSSWEDALSKMAENYKAAVEEASRNFEQGFSPLFNTLALLQAQFDREKALGDLYVDNYQRIHDLNKLNRDIQLSIDDTDNLKGKERLRDLQAEINQLQEDGTELSEYDLDILDKKYKLELARQALEDAKDAKSMVRLARDNNGNWSYVYTANQDDVEKAEQDYEDAIREMEQANEDYIDNIQDQILQVQQEAQQAILALQPEDFATYEDYLAAVNNIQNSMYQTLDFLRSQLNNAFGNNEWLDPYIVDRYGVNDHDLTTDFGDTTLARLLDNPDVDKAMKKAKQNFEDTLKKPVLDAFIEYSERQDEVYKAAEHDIATIGKDFQDEMESIADSSDYQVEVVENLANRITNSFKKMALAAYEIIGAFSSPETQKQLKYYELLVEAVTEVKRLSGENLPAGMTQEIGTTDTWREIEDLENLLKENGHIRVLEDLTNLNKEDVVYRDEKLKDATEKIDEWVAALGDATAEIAEGIERNDVGQITNYKDIVQKLAGIEQTDENKETLKNIKKWKEKDDTSVLMDDHQVLTDEGLWTYLVAGDDYTKQYMKDKIDNAAKNGAIDVGADVDETEKAKVEDYWNLHQIVYVKWDGGLEKFETMEDWLAWYEKHRYVPPASDGGGSSGGIDESTWWWIHDNNHGGWRGFDTGGYTGRWQSADTGMYTGEWPSGSVRRNGRLAWLHQKELVLNAHDTENFLDAMQIVRKLDNLTNWMANGLGDLIMPNVSSEMGELEQNVHIEAEFPNVTDHNEIEQAFNNLVNMASQYANRK